MRKCIGILLVVLMATVFACGSKSDEPKNETAGTPTKNETAVTPTKSEAAGTAMKDEAAGTPISKDQILGHWQCADVILATGTSMKSLAKGQNEYTFNEDNTVLIGVPGVSATTTAEYKIENNGVLLYKAGIKLYELKLEGSDLVMDDKDSDLKIIFRK